MLTPAGRIILGIIATSTALFSIIYFLDKSVNEKEPRESFKYLMLSIGCILSFIFSMNVI
ncbi:hypothetical protein [Clostridium sp. B9]|uniref:hypothetical protein n=1 Tax=Clostridium sp. B9 TaxID=3423224 RepID=UPI003D2F0A75